MIILRQKGGQFVFIHNTSERLFLGSHTARRSPFRRKKLFSTQLAEVRQNNQEHDPLLQLKLSASDEIDFQCFGLQQIPDCTLTVPAAAL